MNSMKFLKKKCEIEECVSIWTLIVEMEHVVDIIVIYCLLKYHTDTSFCRSISCLRMCSFGTDGPVFSRKSSLLKRWRDPRLRRQLVRHRRHSTAYPSRSAYGRVCAEDNEAINGVLCSDTYTYDESK
jgi:hypothetical protein